MSKMFMGNCIERDFYNDVAEDEIEMKGESMKKRYFLMDMHSEEILVRYVYDSCISCGEHRRVMLVNGECENCFTRAIDSSDDDVDF